MEFGRQGISWTNWQASNINKSYNISNSYPPTIVVPQFAPDDILVRSSKVRSKGEIPIVAFAWKRSKANIFRAGAMENHSYKKFVEDKKLIEILFSMNPNQTKWYIFDTGSYQSFHSQIYPDASYTYLNIPTLEEQREILTKLQNTVQSEENSKKSWLSFLQALLTAAKTITIVIESSQSILVQRGNDIGIENQVISLAQLMLDPYYRTIEGFAVLIEKDWFNYPFAKRNGFGKDKKRDDEGLMDPIFLQFIDCVWQLWFQFPAAFEFNEEFLIFILNQTYSCRFGNFLGNNPKEKLHIASKTTSIWHFVNSESYYFTNHYYSPTNEVLRAAHNLVRPWKHYYFNWNQYLAFYDQRINRVFQRAIRYHSKEIILAGKGKNFVEKKISRIHYIMNIIFFKYQIFFSFFNIFFFFISS